MSPFAQILSNMTDDIKNALNLILHPVEAILLIWAALRISKDE